jgi:hypothetical protein
MIVFLQQSNPAKPSSFPYTDAERVAAHRSIFGAYAGTYTVEGNKVEHHVIASWRPDNIGTKLIRFFEIEGKQLTLKTAPQKSSLTPGEQVATLVFERIE